MKLIYLFGLTILMSGNECSSEYVNDTRIFVEGKISSGMQTTGDLPLQLINQDILVSKGTTKSDGTFRLGGAGTTNRTSLFINQKIESFSTTADGCVLSYDSLSIILPENKNYVKFSNIQLQ